MLTHNEVKKLNRKLKRVYGGYGPKLIKATTFKHAYLSAIQLLNPTDQELAEAIETAFEKHFDSVIIHTKRTFRRFI